jgi:hypothetical protein
MRVYSLSSLERGFSGTEARSGKERERREVDALPKSQSDSAKAQILERATKWMTL